MGSVSILNQHARQTVGQNLVLTEGKVQKSM